MSEVKIDTGVYRHYKGGLYWVEGISYNSSNGDVNEGQAYVSYISLTTGKRHHRLYSEFVGPTWDTEAHQQVDQRFTKVVG